MPILPLFTTASICLFFIVQTDNPLLVILATDSVLYAGLICVVLSGLLAATRRSPPRWNYDVFALGTLMIWSAYWREFIRVDAPLFHFYPVFFVLLTGVFTLFIVNPGHRFDADTLSRMMTLYRLKPFSVPVLAGLTLASLYFPNHFVMYPLVLSLLILRYAIGTCLDTHDRLKNAA